MKVSWLLYVVALSPYCINALTVEAGSLRTDGTAFQIQASSSDGLWPLPEFWDTGRVRSDDSFVVYNGEELQSRSTVFWRARVWDVQGIASAWSETSIFEVSLLDASDWKASWITNPGYSSGNTSLPLFAKEFLVPCTVAKARLYLLGLGIHAPEINGNVVGDSNVIGIALEKGIYDADEPLGGRYTKFTVPEQELKLISQLEFTCIGESHSVVSDNSWVTTVQGPHLEGHWYGDEEYDARKEVADWSRTSGMRDDWNKASVTTGPQGVLTSPRSPPLKVVETVKAIAVNQVGDQWVFDFGVNFAGTFSFKINGQSREGTRIVFYPSEIVNEGGGPDQSTTEGPIFDAHTIKGEKSEVASNEPVLSVSTSNNLFNGIHKIIDRSIQSNMYSVLTDCPHREKAMIAVPLKLYKYYGDVNVLKMRAGGKPYLNDGGLGDWLTLDTTTPKGVASTFGYQQAVQDMAEVEEILGNIAEAASYRALSDGIKQGFNDMWFNTTGSPHYSTNCQGCNAIALDMGAVADEYKSDVLGNIITSLESNDWHWTVGEISLPSLIRVLHKYGRDDAFFKIFSRTTIPSYGSQVAYGATSLWEHWDAPETGGSWNHFMSVLSLCIISATIDN
ncbi:putative exported rhamnosidase a protein [Eutypa lata UCREL1]|uniref:alpha-L-rhamnosidase n=1 Tax=Eutypa lata (strain UCR-EL1) TaxID=1287681 RepID=M7SV29_EUTLA|nr:putative exported rhamnosidase a protein [Eutypa lata UCREL1]